MVVYNSNPPRSRPIRIGCCKGFRREDLFTVVLEQFQTDTADYADILLPATTFLEHTDLYLCLRPLSCAAGAAGRRTARRGAIERGSLSRLSLREWASRIPVSRIPKTT